MNRRAFLDRVGVAGVAGLTVGLASAAPTSARTSATGTLQNTPAADPRSSAASQTRPDSDATPGSGPAKPPDVEQDALRWPKPATDHTGDPFPSHDPALVLEMVTVSHFNLDRVGQLLAAQPAMAKASWDWGFGDWETALGAASHVGNRPIAELLLKHGAPPTIFSAAMLGQLDVVKATIAANPGIERKAGPHGITLLAHARAGRDPAAAVVAYLEALGTADDRPTPAPLDPTERAALLGGYAFGPNARDVLIVDEDRNGLNIRRVGAARRVLRHHGALEFSPPAADAVRVRFARDAAGGPIVSVTITGLAALPGGSSLTARRSSAPVNSDLAPAPRRL